MLAIPVLGRLRLGDYKFETSLSYITRPMSHAHTSHERRA